MDETWVLEMIRDRDCRTDAERDAMNKAIEALKQPERKKGEWQEVYAETDYRNGWIEFSCENCEYQHGLESGQYGWSFGDQIPWKYCPICGADMRGEQDEVD